MIDEKIINVDRDKIDEVNKSLFKKLRKNPDDMTILNDIVRVNIPIVLYLVNSFGVVRDSNVYDDLVSECLIILSQAIKKFNYRKGKFSTYAFSLIRFRCPRLFAKYANTIRIPERKRFMINKLENDIFHGGKISKEEEEILKTKCEYVHDVDWGYDLKNEDIFFDWNKYKEQILLEDEIQYAKDWNVVFEKILCDLSNVESDVIRMYFGIGCKSMCHREISIKLGLSRERIRQIGCIALRKIRRLMVKKKMVKCEDRTGKILEILPEHFFFDYMEKK